MGYSTEQNLDLSRLWVASRETIERGNINRSAGNPGREILAAALIVTCAGHTAMIFLSPQPRGRSEIAVELARRATAAMRSESVTLVQALLDDYQFSEQQVLEGAATAGWPG